MPNLLSLLSLSLCPSPSPPTGFHLSRLRTSTSDDSLNLKILHFSSTSSPFSSSSSSSSLLGSAEAHLRLRETSLHSGRLAEPAGATEGGLGLQTDQGTYDFVLLAGTLLVTDRTVDKTTTIVLKERYTGGGAEQIKRPAVFVSPKLNRVYIIYQRAFGGGIVRTSYALAPLEGGPVEPTVADDSVNLDTVDLTGGTVAVYDSVQVVKVPALSSTCATTQALYYDVSGLYVRETDLGTERVDARGRSPLAYSIQPGIDGCLTCGSQIVATDLVTGTASVVASLTTAQLEELVYGTSIGAITTEYDRRPALEVIAAIVAVVIMCALLALFCIAIASTLRVRFRRSKVQRTEIVTPARTSAFHPESARPVDVDKATIDLQRLSQRASHKLSRDQMRPSQRQLLAGTSPDRCSTASEASPATTRSMRWTTTVDADMPAARGLSRLRFPGDASAIIRRYSLADEARRRSLRASDVEVDVEQETEHKPLSPTNLLKSDDPS